ncbi:hypothetical protein UA45_17445 [Morganella morganii]|uniref:Uncharacterized protein n=1 Tax=Morganella morganii TaxID=582 RepID=A0A0D8L4K6_MORMO|nr:hypothetical protein UA45_17445 [Morganella morganii]
MTKFAWLTVTQKQMVGRFCPLASQLQPAAYLRYAPAALHQGGNMPSPPTSTTGRCAEVNPDNDG